jgi:hypothetical protein
MRKVVLVSVPVAAAAAIVAALLIEIAIRVTWDPTRGRPGFIVADAGASKKLAPNATAGCRRPVHQLPRLPGRS